VPVSRALITLTAVVDTEAAFPLSTVVQTVAGSGDKSICRQKFLPLPGSVM
jgi:hypothetical protein